MSDLIQKIQTARRDAAEQAVIASIPQELLDNMARAQAKFEADGGCKGCGSKIIAVHYLPCSVCENEVDL